jgi:hypothetical protein
MIIKSKARKNIKSVRQLFEYITRTDSLFRDESGKTMLIKHNLRGAGIDEWCREYTENEAYRIHRKKNTNAVYHEIIAFHEWDRHQITLATLEKVTREYIRQRNPHALVIATAHMDQPHIHVHLAISGVEYRTGQSLRVSKEVFNDMKLQMEKYQEREFPEIVHSIVDFGKKKA